MAIRLFSKKCKKAMIFNITLVILTIVVLTYAYIRLSSKMDVTKEIGESPMELIAQIQEGEKALIFLDFAAKMAIFQAVYELQAAGGVTNTSACGTYYGFNRWNADNGTTCFVDANTAKDSLRDFFVSNLVARVAAYPSADFVGNVPGAAFSRGSALAGTASTASSAVAPSTRTASAGGTGDKVIIYMSEGQAMEEFRRVSRMMSTRLGAAIYGASNGQEILDAINRHDRIGRLILAGHGTPRSFLRPGTAGLRVGSDDLPRFVSVDTFARTIAPKLTANAVIGLAGCSSGSSPGETGDRISKMGPGGTTGLAAKIRDSLAQQTGIAQGVEIRAHSTAAHLSTNPYARTFRVSTAQVNQPGVSVLDENWGPNAHQTRTTEWISRFRGDPAQDWIFGEAVTVPSTVTATA